MNTSSITIHVPESESLPPSLLSNIESGFKGAFEQAEKWRTQALAIKVESIDQKAEMKLARTIRLELKNVRVSAEKTRVALKADALRMGKAIDGVNNLLLAAIVPLETYLEDQEKFGERLIEQERQRVITERTEAIRPFIPADQPLPALDVMSPEGFASYLADAKLLHETKIEAARKAEADRVAAEAAAAAERERMRLENERLKKEAEEREAKAKAEREAAAKAQAAIEAKAKAEREAAERELARIKAEADEAARKEALRQQALREVERQKAESERKSREQLEAEIAAKKAAELEAEQAKDEAAKKAASAPDKEKLIAFAEQVRSLKVPHLSTQSATNTGKLISEKVEAFANWIIAQCSNL